MPFTPPCFAPEFFFDPGILAIVRALLGERIVADQWGCDAPILGSEYQQPHVDYARPLFAELPDLELPPYMIVVSFGLVPIASANGAIEIAPGTHRLPRGVASGAIPLQPVPLALGDVLIRHPWALHRGTPNTTAEPRPLLSIRYVRRWYADASREVCTIPWAVWKSLTLEQQAILRFPVAG
jgi:ectoine hydroxylase-related dioxygenase (phytanoyl-CoA dioxygenase family)